MVSRMRTFTVAISAVLILIAAQTTNAQVVPFWSVGFNNNYMQATGDFFGSGFTVPMGPTSGSGIAIPTPTDDPLVFDWTATGEFVSNSGNQLFFVGGGQVFLETDDGVVFTASWIGEFFADGGSGIYENAGPADEPLDVIAVNHPFTFDDPVWTYDYVITGAIDLGRSRRDK